MVNWDWVDSGSILGLLGDIDPLDPDTDLDELQEAQDYLLEQLAWGALEPQNDEYFEDLQSSLWDLSSLSSDIQGEEFAGLELPLDNLWIPVKDGDARARALFERHYSARLAARKRSKTKLFVGPGQKQVLLTPTCDALFVWRLEKLRDDKSYGANCAVFRNEGSRRSSELILAAEEYAQLRWPFVPRMFTYVNPAKIKSTNPGYCFKMAGWRQCGVSKKGLLHFEKLFIPIGCMIPWNT